MSDPRTWTLGPVPCSACKRQLGWDGVRWLELYGGPHRCPGTPRSQPPAAVAPVETPEVRAILRAVALDYMLRPGDVVGRIRRKDYVEARAEAAYRLWSETELTLAAIGEILGGRDHSTIAYLIARYNRRSGSSAESNSIPSDASRAATTCETGVVASLGVVVR